MDSKCNCRREIARRLSWGYPMRSWKYTERDSNARGYLTMAMIWVMMVQSRKDNPVRPTWLEFAMRRARFWDSFRWSNYSGWSSKQEKNWRRYKKKTPISPKQKHLTWSKSRCSSLNSEQKRVARKWSKCRITLSKNRIFQLVFENQSKREARNSKRQLWAIKNVNENKR